MIDTSVQAELLQQLEMLSPAKQRRVVAFARSLAKGSPLGVPGDRLLRHAGTMTHEEAREISKIDRGRLREDRRE